MLLLDIDRTEITEYAFSKLPESIYLVDTRFIFVYIRSTCRKLH